MKKMHKLLFSLGLLYACAASATTYEVGPTQTLTNLNKVPWESLNAGDTVLIDYTAVPYNQKFVICRQGTANAPITIRGVPGPNGELPVITGSNATTRIALNYWGANRSLIKIGGANVPADTMPRYITIENLDVRSARPPFVYTNWDKTAGAYVNSAAGIWIEKGENITIRNCIIHDCGNGLFVSSGDVVSTNVLVESCYIFGNGNTNSAYEHNVYTEALGITFQYNHFGPLRSGCPGNNLKDRSAGLVVRNNWIQGGNRELDLVDAEDSTALQISPLYGQTFVYGNVFVEPSADGNNQIVHYGGDSGNSAIYRKGTLYFYNNTVVSKRTDNATMFKLDTNDEHCDARNNVFHGTVSTSGLTLTDAAGVLNATNNWIRSNYKVSSSTLTGAVTLGGNVFGTSPGFTNQSNGDYHLLTTSTCRNAGTALNAAVLPAYDVTNEYVVERTFQPRWNDGRIDIGAFEVPGDSTNSVPNPYAALAGTYNGLFFETNQVRSAHAGFFSILVKTNGVFTGNNYIRGVNRALSSRFVDGACHLVLATNPALTMDMTIDLGGSGVVTGSVNGTNWSAPLFGERAGYVNPATVRDALSLSSAGDGSLAPGGDGFGVANISTNGKFTLTGTLSDGVAFSAIGGSLAQNGDWPICSFIYSNTGIVIGWLTQTSGVYGGTLSWVKPTKAGTNYLAGFTNSVNATVSALPTMTKTKRALAITNGIVSLSDGSLPSPLTNYITMTASNTFIVSAGQTNALKLSLNVTNGQISGSFTNPVSKKLNSIKGIVMPDQSNARGFYLSPQTGRFLLQSQ